MAAKIFRINYKSDFILTLESDAGWMTPFCIKFWTSLPSLAYFVGWDGETYTHCAYDPSEPSKLTVQFDDHHLPIGNLKYQVAYHFTVADFPNDTEDEVMNQANITTEIDGQTYQVMLDFNGETAPEIQFALPAYAAEAQRIANEEQRIANEQQRIRNEETRIDNEQTRINQESARVNEYAELKADAVAATGAANDAAALANQKAGLADDAATLATQKAGLADGAATLATQKAGLADDAATLATQKAGLADDAATLATQKAGLANDAATLATQKAQYAQDKGDYAKAQGDYAKSQADLIPADVMRTASDAAFVNANHEALFCMRQADATLAGLMTSAEHNKLAALPTASNLETGIIYDVSALHPTSGVSGGSTYSSLSAALAVIPQAKRKGGMSVKYVQSSDNKYVQFRYMSSSTAVADFANVSNWQGVDAEPTVGSHNLVESGGVEKELYDTEPDEDDITINTSASYVKAYFDTAIESGTLIKSMSGTTTSFYFVNSDDTLDTSALIKDTSFPLTTTKKYIGVASSVAGTLTLTIATTKQVSKFATIESNLNTIGRKIGTLPTGKTVSDIICEPALNTESIVAGPAYTKGYFQNSIAQGTKINSASFSGEASWFYWVKEGDTTDTTTQINSASFPLTTPYKIIGISCPGQTQTTVTIEIEEGLQDKVQDINTRVQALEGKKGWEGKTVVCFGDSITMFPGVDSKTWTQHLSEITGATIINVGVGGATYRQRTTPVINPSDENEARSALDVVNMVKASIEQEFTKQENGAEYIYTATTVATYKDIVQRLEGIDWNSVDAVVLFAGTNDWYNVGQMLGNDDSVDFTYTKGALNYIISSLCETYPNIQINLLLPIVRYVDPLQFDSSKSYEINECVMYLGQRYKFIAQHSGAWDANDVTEITSYQARVDELWCDIFKNPDRGNLTLREYGENIAEFIKKKYHLVARNTYDIGWNRVNFDTYFIDTDATHPLRGFKQLAYSISKLLIV